MERKATPSRSFPEEVTYTKLRIPAERAAHYEAIARGYPQLFQSYFMMEAARVLRAVLDGAIDEHGYVQIEMPNAPFNMLPPPSLDPWVVQYFKLVGIYPPDYEPTPQDALAEKMQGECELAMQAGEEAYWEATKPTRSPPRAAGEEGAARLNALKIDRPAATHDEQIAVITGRRERKTLPSPADPAVEPPFDGGVPITRERKRLPMPSAPAPEEPKPRPTFKGFRRS